MTVVTAAVFVYYPVNITANWVEPPVRFQTVSGITTVLSDDNTAAVIDVATTKGLMLDARHAFIYDDFSTDPFSGRLTANTGAWSWNPAGYIQVSADGPSGGGYGGMHVAYYSTTIPPGTSTVYVLSKERHVTTASGQHIGLTMIESDNRLYTLQYYRDRDRRLGIWRYLRTWSFINRRIQTLADNTWFIFLGSRNVNSGVMTLTVYSSGGVQQGTALSATDTSISVSRVGLGIRDETLGGGSLSASFDDFVACADADPRFVNVTGLQQGWIARIEYLQGNTPWASADANGFASINVIAWPIVRDGYLHVCYADGTTILRQHFPVIVGGDVYSYVSVLPNLRILDFRNFDSSKPYDVSLRIESLNVDGSYVNSMNIWISSGSSTSTPIRIYNNAIATYETSTLTLAANSLGHIYSNATFRSLSRVTLILTFRYSLTGVEVEYLNSITLRVHR